MNAAPLTLQRLGIHAGECRRSNGKSYCKFRRNVNNAVKKKVLSLVMLSLFFLCFSSCARIDPITPADYSNLLLKIKELFAFCTALISQGQGSLTHNGQSISRMYYAFYHLARLYNINKYNKDIGRHDKTWGKVDVQGIKDFGHALKALREKYDYDPIDPSDGTNVTRTDFSSILLHKTAAESLIEMVELTLPDFKNLQPNADIYSLMNCISDIRKEHNRLFNEIETKVLPTENS